MHLFFNFVGFCCMNIETFDLSLLPMEESDYFEFKSSLTPTKELKKKLYCAVSGFANSGGGCFVAGIDEHSGEADGGIPLKIGSQNLSDWSDQIINCVNPVPRYAIKLLQDPMGRGVIQSDSAVLVVSVEESHVGPHMAPDYRYYIRAGAHTLKAQQFIVDAIWAKRHFSKPRLTHLFRLKQDDQDIIQIGVLALTDSPAIDVEISIFPLPKTMQKQNLDSVFPLKIPVVDRNTPFFFDVVTYYKAEERFGEDSISIAIEYYDLAANPYTYTSKLELSGSVPPINLKHDTPFKILKTLEAMSKSLSQLTTFREKASKPSFILSKPPEKIFSNIESLIPNLLSEMRADLCEYPFAREFILINKNAVYIDVPHNLVLRYYFESHPFLRSKLRILENHALIYEITFNNTARFIMTEEFVDYLMNASSEG